jgi:alginate O-acetyltransferase complex protein AlgI
MPFNSISFLIFFLVFTAIYSQFGNAKYKSLFLIAGSWFFYSYGNIYNLIHLLITTSVTYFIAKQIRKKVKNKWYLTIGVSIIVLQLLLTKYSYVLAQLFSIYPFSDNQFMDIYVLPIGISFYSLQAIGLLVDVQRRKYDLDFNFRDVSLFLSLFPQSISGPIHRANELLPQFNLKIDFQADNIIIGLKTILWGYFCKLIIADKISIITIPIFNSYSKQDGLSILIATLLYSLQIYFDFWGYSLIAIGAGRVLGFNISTNFNNPYAAISFKDFWHRWHITLSKWMRDYIYIPLGGRNQRNYVLYCGSILITFLVSGFWHGITINFILWGATHAFFYMLEDFIKLKYNRNYDFKTLLIIKRLFRLFRAILFFIIISTTWLIFRTNNFTELVEMLKSIITFSNWSIVNAYKQYFILTTISYLLIIILTLFFSQTMFLKRKIEIVPFTAIEKVTDSVFIFICLTMIILWGDIGGQEFLYFRF